MKSTNDGSESGADSARTPLQQVWPYWAICAGILLFVVIGLATRNSMYSLSVRTVASVIDPLMLIAIAMGIYIRKPFPLIVLLVALGLLIQLLVVALDPTSDMSNLFPRVLAALLIGNLAAGVAGIYRNRGPSRR